MGLSISEDSMDLCRVGGFNGLFGSVRSRPNWQNQSSKRAGSECRALISLRVYALRVRANKAPTLTPATAKPLNPEA